MAASSSSGQASGSSRISSISSRETPKSSTRRRSPTGCDVVGLVVLGRRHAEPVEGVEAERPVLGGEQVGEQQPDLLAEHAHEDEELLGDRDEAEHAALAGLGAQRADERVERVRGVGRQHDHLPEAVLAPGGDREVDGVVVHDQLPPREHDGRRRRTRVSERRACRRLVVPKPVPCDVTSGTRTRRARRPTGRRTTTAPRDGVASAYPSGHVREPAHPRRRPPADRAQADHAARLAHRLADLPAPRRRAGDAARLRGHARDPRRARRRQHAGRAGHGRQARRPAADRRADPARRARHARRHDAAAPDRRGRASSA